MELVGVGLPVLNYTLREREVLACLWKTGWDIKSCLTVNLFLTAVVSVVPRGYDSHRISQALGSRAAAGTPRWYAPLVGSDRALSPTRPVLFFSSCGKIHTDPIHFWSWLSCRETAMLGYYLGKFSCFQQMALEQSSPSRGWFLSLLGLPEWSLSYSGCRSGLGFFPSTQNKWG